MARINPFLRFSNPPMAYSPGYFADIVRAFAAYVQQADTPGEGRNTTIVLTNLQTDDYRLETGTLFQVDGVVRVSLLTAPYVRGLSATVALGTVAVTP